MKKILLFLSTLVLAGIASPAIASNNFSHAAGFICGTGPTTNRIVAGDYRVAFNILNGSRERQRVSLGLSLTFPAGITGSDSFEPGDVIPLSRTTLAPGQAVMIDCDELVKAFESEFPVGPPYISGILDVRSSAPLQVTAMQGAGPEGQPLSTLSVTLVPAVRLRPHDNRDRDRD